MTSISDLLKLMRYGNCVMSAVAAILGALVSSKTMFASHLLDAAAAGAVVFLFTGAGNTLNDYLDATIDANAHPGRPIPSGRISRENAQRFSVLLFTFSVLISLVINIPAFLLVLFSLFIMMLYEFRLKKTGLAGNLSISWLTASLFLFGALSVGETLTVWALFATSFMATLGREIIKDIQDIDADKGIRKTLPMEIGRENAGRAASAAIASAIIVSPFPYLLHQFGLGYLAVVLAADLIFLASIIQRHRNPARSQSTTKVAMYAALLAFLVGALGV
ncbi:MAG: UbiA family prenyltransferase [Thermoplasmata archaeon]|jgi:geranylgeranylglycerol-phosphate geranylgeranyltransferase|nr:UbiA family prenyltransferase [Candidatus Sysuiplasma jiujiangense]MBX8641450.1 UbiA family prenyltransferase [Candidatus Sysuiplasma jiujiangense]